MELPLNSWWLKCWLILLFKLLDVSLDLSQLSVLKKLAISLDLDTFNTSTGPSPWTKILCTINVRTAQVAKVRLDLGTDNEDSINHLDWGELDDVLFKVQQGGVMKKVIVNINCFLFHDMPVIWENLSERIRELLVQYSRSDGELVILVKLCRYTQSVMNLSDWSSTIVQHKLYGNGIMPVSRSQAYAKQV